MPETTLLLLFLALLISLALAGFQYFYKSKGNTSQNFIFSVLRFISLFSLLVLLINPQIDNTEYFTEKPDLILAVDNSSSIENFGEVDRVRQFVDEFKTDEELQERFDLQVFQFGKQISQNAALNFEDTQTNIPAALKDLNKFYEQKIAPTILITDGNQTLGEDYQFVAQRYSQAILPVIVGDTTRYQDLEISRVNTNKYAYQNNFFPVEIIVNYTGDEAVDSRLQIRTGAVTVYSEDVSFDKENKSAVVETNLPSVSVGVSNYEVRLRPLTNEKNVANNTKEFALEVIDQRTKVLLVYSKLHPDVGAIKKAIESNQQREVEIVQASDFSGTVNDYQLLILYQPGAQFRSILNNLKENNRNYWIISGPETDWRFLNTEQEIFQQEITGQTEDYLPLFNESFGAFQVEDIGYSSFPPLSGNFGNLSSSEGVEAILYRQVQGVATQEPLLAVMEQRNSKMAFLFGADLWKWRSHIYQENASFEAFDTFIGKLVQYLSSDKSKERLEVSYEALYRGSDGVVITAEYFDRNYVFDSRGKLELRLENIETGEVRQIPFRLNASQYEVDLSSLPAGEYNFVATVEGESLREAGKFQLLNFDVEKQFGRANLEGLQNIADDKGQDLYFLSDFVKLKEDLLKNDSYLPVQKSRINNVPLIDWYYLLAIIILALSTEWFLRKYYGYI